MNTISVIELCLGIIKFLAKFGDAYCLIQMIMSYYTMGAVKHTGSKLMNTISVIELCLGIIKFLAKFGDAYCLIQITEPYHPCVIGNEQ